MLDSDLAARSASQARIYSDLGFQQRALLEGYNAVNTDPTNHSAHRFLADSYSVRPRHEIARVSELLQSQLLQPNNITPIQPRLAESNLFLMSAGGSGALSFNEFNPLFNRNQTAFQASGMVGENQTWGGEGVISGIYNKLSLSAGYNHFETEGFRINNDQDDDIANVFVQYELTHKTSIQAEYRYRDSERGFLQLRFDPTDFPPKQRLKEESGSIRFGFRHSFSPKSNLIGNFTHLNKDSTQRDEPGAIFGPFGPRFDLVEFKTDEEAYGAEAEYLFRSEHINLVGGVGYFDIDSPLEQTTKIFFPTPPFPPPPIGPGGTTQTTITPSDLDVEHTNLYLYSYIKYPQNVTWTVGVSGDFFDSVSEEAPDEDQFNPKFGVTWNPVPNTTLRGAVFRVLRRTLLTDQTLEPTQVAGFNQFFDDTNATEAWRYGGAVDQRFTESIYGGVEYSKRDLTVPFLRTGLPPGELEWDEKLFRAYLYWAPHKWFALSGEYMYEEFNRDASFSDGALFVETDYFPLGINFFHPSGLSASLRGTYIDQEGSFERIDSAGTFTPGEDDFWLVDVAISYRLPKRYGFITVGVTNLFDKEFQYFDTDRDNPRIIPDSFFFVRATLAF